MEECVFVTVALFSKVDVNRDNLRARITNVFLRRIAATAETTAGMVQMSSTVEEVRIGTSELQMCVQYLFVTIIQR